MLKDSAHLPFEQVREFDRSTLPWLDTDRMLLESRIQLDFPGVYKATSTNHPSLNTVAGGVKRALDLTAILLAAPIYLPLMALLALMIKLESKGPAFFVQKRVGLHGQTFHMYKFRSMHLDAEERLVELKAQNEMKGPLFKIKDDPRVTRVGKWIRKLSLDELPQLFNVLKGEMSLVGPRPPLPSEVAEFEPSYMEKFAVRPGLTGLWQVCGRSELSEFKQAIALDLHYVRTWTPLLDLQILLKTIKVVLDCRGAS